MNRNLIAIAAVFISATLLFASTGAGFIAPAFGQIQQQETNNNTGTIIATATPEVMPVNQTDAKEILDNLYDARQAIMFGQELEALKHLDNIENIITGMDVVVSILVAPVNDNETETANEAITRNNSELIIDNEDAVMEEEPEGTEQNPNNVTAPFDESLPSTTTSQSSSERPQIVPIQQNMSAAQGQDTRTFRVTFERIEINQDHDPVFEGEWLMDVYVNQHRVPLFPGSISVSSGDTYTFDQNNEITVTVPADTGHIWLTTAGWENDVGFEPLPDLTPGLAVEIPPEEGIDAGFEEDAFLDEPEGEIGELEEDVFVDEFEDEFERSIGQDITFAEYTRAIQGTIAEHTAGLSNDPQGVVKKALYTGENIAGQYSDCSEPNEFAVDNIKMWYEQDCDFVLHWSIEEVQ